MSSRWTGGGGGGGGGGGCGLYVNSPGFPNYSYEYLTNVPYERRTGDIAGYGWIRHGFVSLDTVNYWYCWIGNIVVSYSGTVRYGTRLWARYGGRRPSPKGGRNTKRQKYMKAMGEVPELKTPERRVFCWCSERSDGGKLLCRVGGNPCKSNHRISRQARAGVD